MHHIVMWLGAIIAGIGAFFFLMIVVTAGLGNSGSVVAAIGVGGGLIISGAMLYCFGAIVDHLAAIRVATEAQAKLFAERAASTPPENQLTDVKTVPLQGWRHQ